MAPAPTVETPPPRTEAKRADDDEVKPYVIVSEIGKGSFATVYRGFHGVTSAAVAIKTVSRAILTPKLVENLESEISILKQLKHRHITELLDIVKAERNIYLIMEYCSGGDLSFYIKRRGRIDGLQYIPSPGEAPMYYPHPRIGGLDETCVRSFLRQLARALKFLRHRNLIHRDIKPQNLLLMPAADSDYKSGHPLGIPLLKIADFGFARSLPNATMAETLCGSPLYMAPEILRYEKYDAKADLWSVGAVLYEMSVGKPPFRAQNHMELLRRIEQARSTVRFPDEEDSNVTPVAADIKKLIRSLLKRHPIERASFDDFFASKALVNSKFPARRSERPVPQSLPTEIPPSHRVIPPEVLDPKALIPRSTFNFRRPSRTAEDEPSAPPSPSSSDPHPTPQDARTSHRASPTPSHPHANREVGPSSPRLTTRSPRRSPMTEPVIIPGETEEDGYLRSEYVMVGDTRVLEFNKAVDDIQAVRNRKSSLANSEKRSNPGSQIDHNRFPPPPQPGPMYGIEPIPTSPTRTRPVRAASSALSRALNMAGRKLFGATPSTPPQTHQHLNQISRRQIFVTPGNNDPLEEELLAGLEDLAQKAHVLTRWADEMYDYVKAIPQKPIPDPAKFVRRDGEPAKHAAKRRHADIEAEYSAVTSAALYMLIMSFAQKGLDQLRDYMDNLDEYSTPSAGYDDALEWFATTFQKCSERAHLVKSWLPEGVDENTHAYVDQMVYDRALALSRGAARKEILDQAVEECEAMYEDSLWILYALTDPVMQLGNPFMEEDRNTINTWITRTKLRLVRCRARANMDDRARLKDARADQNLDDCNRYPAPWELKPLPAYAETDHR